MLSKLWEQGAFCFMFIFSATVKKYLLKAFATSWRPLIVFPSIFKVLIASVFPVLLVSRFTIYGRTPALPMSLPSVVNCCSSNYLLLKFRDICQCDTIQ